MNLPFAAERARPALGEIRGVTAVLGPTNTGKTHYAIERMLAHPTGMIGLPLRLLAREVYGRVVERAGAEAVALITGEEKIKPKSPRYWIATVEAMPRDLSLSFVAVDEVQLASDFDRGHVFTDRILNRRGLDETLLIGAGTMQRAISELMPGIHIMSRPRLSKLSYAGDKKITRLPPRTAIVAFSAEEVYAIAEWIRRQKGGAAVVLGALSPRTRNAQVAMYQDGEVDYIVATDAIGMGLNLDVDHVAFASDRKFDGRQFRRLTPAEFGQIAGRAGRNTRDGSFGTTGRCPPLDEELIERLEDHDFDPLGVLQWRNSDLDFTSIEALGRSLDTFPEDRGLTRAPIVEDQLILDILGRDESVRRNVKTRADVARLWDVCQIPDYRKVAAAAHAELVLSVFGYIVRAGVIPDDWFARQLATLDRIDGDIDILAARIAQVRTWTYIANRPDWLADPEHWQGLARRIEDSLSDALHERLAQRFVDRRTSVLMRRLRENAMLEAEITNAGDVMVEGQHVGLLQGFRFTPDPQAAGEAARTLNAAAQKALATEMDQRATRVSEAVDEAFVLSRDGTIRWLGEPIAKLAAGDHILAPKAHVLADEQLTGSPLEAVQRRLDLWLAQHVKKHLGPLADLEAGEGLEGIARGIAFQIGEHLGVLDRTLVAEDVRGLSQDARAALRKFGVRFGAYHLFLPQLLKPAPRALAAQLWALKNGGLDVKGLDEVPHLAASGRTSFVADPEIPAELYRAAGFRVCGERAVRVDILERLADLIRPAISYRPGVTSGNPPPGTADKDAFVVTGGMTSLAGCSGEAFASILRSLGYVAENRPGPAITVPLVPAAPTQPVAASASEAASSGDTTNADAGAAQETETLIGSDDSFLPLGIGEEPTGDEQREQSDEAIAPASETVEEPVRASTESTDAVAESAAPAEAETLVALGEAPIAPEEARASGEAVLSNGAAAPESLENSSDNTEENRAEMTGEPTEIAAEQADETPAEPVMIEVWRMARQQFQRRPERQHKRQPRVFNITPRPLKEAFNAPPRFRRDRTEGHKPEGETVSAEAQTSERPARAPDQRPRFKGEDERRRNDRHEDRRGARPTKFTTETRARDRAPDPDSPFAKLAALKAELEKNKKG
ncbi:MAG: helicase [Methylobacteriaceae bacterium]|nr:helicase [Methylobacteriaceae bacterium]